jgi:hypothetical protein
MGKKSGSGSGINNPNHISERLETIFWVKILKFFEADPKSGMEKIRIWDPGSTTLFFCTTKVKNTICFIRNGLVLLPILVEIFLCAWCGVQSCKKK